MMERSQNKNYQIVKIGPRIKARLNRGTCLWCGDSGSNFNHSTQQCNCSQYLPKGRYGNVCECGHGEIWHHRNNNLLTRLKLTPIINPIISPYINSLKKIIQDLNDREKTLITKIREQSKNNSDSYLCSICLLERRDTVFLPCRHAQFCKGCSTKWLETKTDCPICRNNVECILDIII